MDGYLQLTGWQVGIAAMLVVVNGILSIAFGLRLERSLALASTRMVLQLVIIGYVLKWVFQSGSIPWVILLAVCIDASR